MSVEYAIDMAILKQTHDLLGKKYAMIVNTFLEDSLQYLVQMEQGIAQSQAEQVVQAAHPWKSSSASLGLNGLSAIVRMVEEMARDAMGGHGQLGDLAPRIIELRKALNQAETKLKQLV